MSVDLTDMSKKPAGYFENPREDMLKYIPSATKTSLEFGCGAGSFSALLKERLGVETWAVEMDKEAAKKAKEQLYTVINADACKAVKFLPDAYFDCVIFFDILEHLADPYSLLTSVKKKLTKNGVIVASIPNVRYYRTFVKYVLYGDWDYKSHGVLDQTHLRFFTCKSITKTFEGLNYKIMTLEGMNSTSSLTFRLLNLVLLNSMSDVKYKHFAVVAKPLS